jgi:hypothetical protein
MQLEVASANSLELEQLLNSTLPKSIQPTSAVKLAAQTQQEYLRGFAQVGRVCPSTQNQPILWVLVHRHLPVSEVKPHRAMQ